jgi:Domain of unknown function (DUF4041)/T5orf172 domain
MTFLEFFLVILMAAVSCLLALLGRNYRSLKRLNENQNKKNSDLEISLQNEVQIRSLIEAKFQRVTDIESEVAEILKLHQIALAEIEARKQHALNQIEDLRKQYQDKKELFDRLSHEVSIIDEKMAFAEVGIYKPHFDFDTSETYKRTIEDVRSRQKARISEKTAVLCETEWLLTGSKAKGKAMTDRNIRLTLRAFNGECDAAISNTRWNNASAMEKRLHLIRDQINKLNETNSIKITDGYFKLKLQELQLTHEYREKLKYEKEEKAELARAAREEQKLLRDIEEAEREESKYAKLLEKARIEAGKYEGSKLDQYTQQIEMLEKDLAAAHEKAERAKSMAQLTKSGYVYIISNIGSFGSDVIKIGLTRRLDPQDRVRELGDASVPFTFDTHAIIYSEEAPALERALHLKFAESRINVTNFRKEFFRVTLDDVENAVRDLAPDAPFFKDIEAQEFHETLALRKTKLEAFIAKPTEFPDAI